MQSTRDKPLAQDLAERAKSACSKKDFRSAEQLYTEAINHQPNNAILYCNRSVVEIHLKKYEKALQDANMSIKLNRTYAKGYFHGGMALKLLGNSFSALVMYCNGMVLDPKNRKFLKEIIETSMASSLTSYLSPVISQLKEMNLNHNPFVIISVVGQALLADNETQKAVEILECAVAVGTCSLKLTGSVYSTLSNALWTLGQFSRAIYYMNEGIRVSEQLLDGQGECKSLENLGFAYFTQKRYLEAFQVHNQQLALAKTLKNKVQISSACNGLERIYASLGNQAPPSPQSSNVKAPSKNKENAFLFNEGNKQLDQLDPQQSLDLCQTKLDALLNSPNSDQYEQAQIYCDIARAHRNLKQHDKELECLEKSAMISRNLFDINSESRTLMCLAYAADSAGTTSVSKEAYDRLMEISEEKNDILLLGYTCTHLGMLSHQLGDFSVAIKVQEKCLQIAVRIQDVAAQCSALGNIGNACSAMGIYEKAVQHHLKQLELSQRLRDQNIECCAHGNLAVAFQALGIKDKALDHFRLQLEISRQLRSISKESVALMNLANYFCTSSLFPEAIEMYRSFLELSPRLPNKHGEGRALYNLGYAHFSLGEFDAAVVCYTECIAATTQCGDTVTKARAYCNLGLAKKNLSDFDAALHFQRKFLETSVDICSARGVFKALGNIADIHMEQREPEKAVKFYQQQLETAQENKNPTLTAQACASLAIALRSLGEKEKAIAVHNKEIGIYSEVIKDLKNEKEARKRLDETLAETLQLCDSTSSQNEHKPKTDSELLSEAQAWRNLGITYTNLNQFDQALDCFKHQLNSLQIISSAVAGTEKVNVFCYLGDTYVSLKQYSEAVKYYKGAHQLAGSLKSPKLTNQACRGLVKAYKTMEDLHLAIHYAKESLKICLNLGDQKSLASAYGELGNLYAGSFSYDKAVEALMSQVSVGTQLQSNEILADSSSDLGAIYYNSSNFEKALEFHYLDLEISKKIKNQTTQSRAHRNLARTYESMKNYATSVFHYEQHLFIVEQNKDEISKAGALHGIARCIVMQSNGDLSRAILLLQQSMLIARELNAESLIASIAYDLGKSLWLCNGPETATPYLRQAFLAGKVVCFTCLTGLKDSEVFRRKFLRTYELLLQYGSLLLCNLMENNLHSDAFKVRCEISNFPQQVFTPKSSQSTTSQELMDSDSPGNNLSVFFTVIGGSLCYWLLVNSALSTSGHKPLCFVDCETNVLAQLIFKLRENIGVESLEASVQDKPTTHNGSLYTRLMALQSSFHLRSDFLKTGRRILFDAAVKDGKKYSSAKNPAFLLYELLFSDMEKIFSLALDKSPILHLTIHVDGDLLLVPFSLLKKNNGDKFLYEKFQLTVLPISCKKTKAPVFQACPSRAMVVGNTGEESSTVDAEVTLVSTLLRVQPMVGENAGLKNIVEKLHSTPTECIHFACPFSASPCGIALEKRGVSDEHSDSAEFILRSSDIMKMNLSQTKLMVLASHDLTTDSELSEWTSPLYALLCSIFMAGVDAVLFPLWPVPETACKLFYRTFYGCLLKGCDTAKALLSSKESLRNTAQFQHPSFWAAFTLFGLPSKLSPRDLPTTFAITKLLRSNPSHVKDTIKLCTHMLGRVLVDTDAQATSSTAPVYTTQESIAQKVHGVDGWKELFSSAGFCLKNQLEDLPAVVVFPQFDSNTKEIAQSVLKCMKTFSDLPNAILESLGWLGLSPYTCQSVLLCLEDLFVALNEGVARDFSFNRKLWQTDGCSQLFQLLGYDVISMGENQVILQGGKNLLKSTLQHTIHALRILQTLENKDDN